MKPSRAIPRTWPAVKTMSLPRAFALACITACEFPGIERTYLVSFQSHLFLFDMYESFVHVYVCTLGICLMLKAASALDHL